jgi:plastocyanin
MRSSSLLSIVLVACSAGSDSPPPPDAPPPVPVVVLSSCPAAVDATVVDSPATFVPAMTNVVVTSVVKFSINAEHFVIPHLTQPTDQLLRVSRGETKCFRFDVPGTYSFVCGVHGFVGQINVQ